MSTDKSATAGGTRLTSGPCSLNETERSTTHCGDDGAVSALSASSSSPAGVALGTAATTRPAALPPSRGPALDGRAPRNAEAGAAPPPTYFAVSGCAGRVGPALCGRVGPALCGRARRRCSSDADERGRGDRFFGRWCSTAPPNGQHRQKLHGASLRVLAQVEREDAALRLRDHAVTVVI
jgi:hypothetical protein